MSQQPSVGRIVHYELTEQDVEQIKTQFDAERSAGRLNEPRVGDVYAATIVRVWSESTVNLKVHLDGVPDWWATSKQAATSSSPDEPKDTAGRWFWPPRV